MAYELVHDAGLGAALEKFIELLNRICPQLEGMAHKVPVRQGYRLPNGMQVFEQGLQVVEHLLIFHRGVLTFQEIELWTDEDDGPRSKEAALQQLVDSALAPSVDPNRIGWVLLEDEEDYGYSLPMKWKPMKWKVGGRSYDYVSVGDHRDQGSCYDLSEELLMVNMGKVVAHHLFDNLLKKNVEAYLGK